MGDDNEDTDIELEDETVNDTEEVKNRPTKILPLWLQSSNKYMKLLMRILILMLQKRMKQNWIKILLLILKRRRRKQKEFILRLHNYKRMMKFLMMILSLQMEICKWLLMRRWIMKWYNIKYKVRILLKKRILMNQSFLAMTVIMIFWTNNMKLYIWII